MNHNHQKKPQKSISPSDPSSPGHVAGPEFTIIAGMAAQQVTAIRFHAQTFVHLTGFKGSLGPGTMFDICIYIYVCIYFFSFGLLGLSSRLELLNSREKRGIYPA